MSGRYWWYFVQRHGKRWDVYFRRFPDGTNTYVHRSGMTKREADNEAEHMNRQESISAMAKPMTSKER